MAVLDWVRSSGYRRLWATVRDWNTASRRVLAKVGFIETDRVEREEVYGDTLFTTRRALIRLEVRPAVHRIAARPTGAYGPLSGRGDIDPGTGGAGGAMLRNPGLTGTGRRWARPVDESSSL